MICLPTDDGGQVTIFIGHTVRVDLIDRFGTPSRLFLAELDPDFVETHLQRH